MYQTNNLHIKDDSGNDRLDNFFIKEKKALLAHLAKTLGVSLSRDLSDNIQ